MPSRQTNATVVNNDAKLCLRVTISSTRVAISVRKAAVIYADVESETRRLLATLPERDLEAVVRFFETLRAARAGEGA
jgi:hypothetical protein